MKNKIKKSLSLIMAVLMVLSCWVWVAPTQAEAATTSYRVIVQLNIVDSWDNGDNNFKVDATYKTNNGTGDSANSGQQVASKGAFSNKGKITVFDKTLSGFPTQIHMYYDIAWGRNCTINNVSVSVNGTPVEHDMTGEYLFEGESFGNATGDYYANIAETAYPKPTTIEGLGGTTNITIPDIATPEDANPLSYTYTAKVIDQYGVYWYQAPNYNLSQTPTGTQDMSDSSSGFWWEPNSALTSATVKVNSAMQEIYSLKEGFVKDYYLVAHLSEADGQAVSSQTLHFTYPAYDWYFDANVKKDGKTVGSATITMEDKTAEETRTYAWDSNSDGIPDAIIDKPNYLAYNQKSSILPMYAEKEGFDFLGFWTTPQPDATGAKGQAFSPEATFAPPVDSDTYFNYPDEDKALYTDAGEQWNYRTDSITTGDKKYYAWWLAHDITVKFYDIDGTFIGSFDLKGGDVNTAISTWPTPAYEDGYTSGAFSFGAWTGKWENIDGTVVDPNGYTFTEDLILTPLYQNASFDKVHRVTFYNSTGSEYVAYSKDYNYRDVAAVPADTEVNPIEIYATDYSYTFEGWSSQAPSTDKKYHVVLEDADYDVNNNAIYFAEDFIVRGDTTYYPVFRRHAKPFDVTFGYFDANGYWVDQVVSYKYGQTIVIPEEVPAAYAIFGMEYAITGWTKNGAAFVLGEEVCTGADYYMAQYDAGTRKPYNVTFEYRNEAGELVSKVTEVYEGFEVEASFVDTLVPYDTYDDGTQKLFFKDKWACTDGNTYSTSQLAGYYPGNHVTFSAVYEDGIPFRTVIYVDGDITKSFRVTEGSTLDYWYREVTDGEGNVSYEEYIPSKAATEHGSYEFIGWFDENDVQYIPGTTVVSGDVTLTPKFEYKLYEYNFVFRNYDGSVLAEDALNYGESLAALQREAESKAVRGADAVYTYQFLGWDKKVPATCEGGEPGSTMTFIAQYKPIYIYYNINWYADEAAYNAAAAGTAVATTKYVYGDKIHAPAVTLTPPSDAPEGQNYVFAGWAFKDGEGNEVKLDRNMTVTGDMKFYATYALTQKTWKVTVNAGKTTYTLTVADGAKINELVSEPVAGWVDADKHNAFAGWTSDGAAFDIETAVITADTTIVASYIESAHSYDLSEVVTYPTYPVASFTDYDGTVVAATTGEGLRRFWCECNKEATGTTALEKCKIPALTDAVKPGSTAYVGTSNWADFAEAAGDTTVVYANPKTDFIITTSDKGNVNDEFNKTGKGIGVQKITFAIVDAEDAYASEDDLAVNEALIANWNEAYDWAKIQALLIANYGGWDKVPEVYKDYNANFTAKLSSFNLTDGESYVAYIKVEDKAGNISYMRTAEFLYDATAPSVEVSGNCNEDESLYCEQAVVKVTEATDYTLTVDGVVITEKTANHKYNITGEGMRKVVVSDKAGNTVTKYFTILKEHDKVTYTKAATCLEAGFTSERCLNCGADFNRTEIDELGHAWVDTIVEATCEAHGYISRSCSRCDNTAERQYYKLNDDGTIVKDEDGNDVLLYPAAGHAWDEGVVVKAATCTSAGVKNKTCSVCHATKQEEIPASADAHSFYKPQTVAPTCTEAGKVTRLCRACGQTVVIAQGADSTAANYDAAYAPKGHSFDTWVEVQALRCYAYGKVDGKDYFGSEKNVCSVCGIDNVVDEAVVTRYEYEAAPHTFVVDQRIEPQVGVPGKITYKCSVEGCPGTKDPTTIDALVEYSITFVGVTTKTVTDEETGKTSVVEEATSTVIKDLPGVTVNGATLPEQKKLNSADGKIRYEFDGWYTKKADGSFDKKYTLPMEIGTEDITLYAKFKEKDIFYTVDFKVPTTYTPATETEKESYGGYKAVKSLMGAIGDTRVPGETPTLAATDYFTFTFDGWYTQGTNPTKYDGKIAGDKTYEAKFIAEAKTYKVIFMNDGIVYDAVDVTAGGTASAKGTPVKAADSEYHYSFKGWYTSADGRILADLTDITEKLTVYAVYDKAAHTADETKTTVKQTATCTLPEITEYTCATCGKTWTAITKAANGHTEGAPVYNENTGKNEVHCKVCGELLREADASYTIKFEDWDGRRIGTETVKVNCTFHEQAAEIEKLASRKPDDANEYTFAGWIVNEGDTPMKSSELPAAVADVTYIAAYTATARTFSVTFATSTLVTGTSVAKKTFSGIAYGKVLDKDGNNVTKYEFDEKVFGIPASDSKVHYVFKGWDTDLSGGVKADTLVRPVYEAVKHTFGDGVASAATCTESGGYKYTCSECGYYYITGNVPALDHNYVTTVVKEATYKEEGLAVKTCQRCGDTVNEVIPVKQYITVNVTVKDSNGKAFHGAKVEITHYDTGKVYGPNLTNTEGVATFYVEQSGDYFVRILEIPGREGGMSGDIKVNENGEITSSTVPVPEGESSKECSCGCHRNNFWGMLFRFFHNIIKLLAGRYICCDCPDSRY